MLCSLVLILLAMLLSCHVVFPVATHMGVSCMCSKSVFLNREIKFSNGLEEDTALFSRYNTIHFLLF